MAARYRITEVRSYTGEWISFGFVQRDSDEINFGPAQERGWEASEDGREYTYTLRRGLKWSDGVPLTIEDVRFAFEDHNFNKDINPNLPPQLTDPVHGELAQFSIVDDLNFKVAFDSSELGPHGTDSHGEPLHEEPFLLVRPPESQEDPSQVRRCRCSPGHRGLSWI